MKKTLKIRLLQHKKSTHHNIIGIFMIAFSLLLFGGCSLKKELAKADRIYSEGAYFKVEKMYRKLARKIPKRNKKLSAEIYFKNGECNRILFNMRRAENSYKKAIKKGFKDSIVYLNLAKTEMAMGKYSAALKNFEQFLMTNPTHKEALDGIISARNAQELLKNPSRYIVREEKIFNNRRNSSFSPTIIGDDGDILIFTSNRNASKTQKKSNITGKLNYDLFIAKKNNSSRWEKPKYIKELNLPEDDGVCSSTADGKLLFFTRTLAAENPHAATSIMTSIRSGGEWTEPQLAMIFADSTINTAHPAISPDGETLYFVSDNQQESLGGKDIFRSTKVGNKWGTPQNLGDQINTTGNEMFPYIASDGTLYFASDGHQGFGGLDIYKATTDSLGNWTVENMYAPINSPYDDFGITFCGNKQEGFFASNRNPKHIDKIYSFILPEITYFVSGTIRDEQETPLDAIINIVGDNGTVLKHRVKKNGSYRIKLERDTKYVMLATNRGFLNSSRKINTFNQANGIEHNVDFTLPSIAKPVKMENILYEFGKWEVSKESKPELEKLVKLLEDNPNITIEIAAHTDSVGSDYANIELSQKRANSVISYLIKSGIKKERLQAKGYGKTKPMIVDKKTATVYPFLKEGDELTPNFISKIKDQEQQKICNQINRRTEFRVLRTTYNLY